MLAEKKNKVRYSLNPSGAEWSNDTSKIGQKMIERMGWSSGKGLGRKEDGRVEHVKVECKNDKRGIGCSLVRADQLSSHQDEFQAVLANLAAIHSNTNDIKKESKEGVNDKQNSGDIIKGGKKNNFSNLMETSKTSYTKSRYRKFIQSKNLCNKSEEDMNCIFGIKRLKNDVNIVIEDEEGEEGKSKIMRKSQSCGDHLDKLDDNTQNPESGLKIIMSSSNMNEYFAAKMAKLNAHKIKGVNGGGNDDGDKRGDCEVIIANNRLHGDKNYGDYGIKNVDDEEDKDDCVEMGGAFSGASFSLNGYDDGDNEMSKKKKKKQKKQEDVGGEDVKVSFFVCSNDDDNGDSVKVIDGVEKDKMSKKERKKKRKAEKMGRNEEVDGVVNGGVDGEVDVGVNEKRKKKEKSKEEDDLKGKDEEVVVNKKNKKKKNKNSLKNELEIVEVVENNVIDVCTYAEIKKKDGKNKMKNKKILNEKNVEDKKEVEIVEDNKEVEIVEDNKEVEIVEDKKDVEIVEDKKDVDFLYFEDKTGDCKGSEKNRKRKKDGETSKRKKQKIKE